MGEFAPREVSPLGFTPEELRERGLVFDVTTLPQEAEIAQEFQAHFMARVAVANTVRIAETPRDGTTLAESVDGAALGDPEADKRVDLNVSSATVEGVFKKHRTKVEKIIGPGGLIMQLGMSIHQMQFNSLVHRRGRHKKLEQHSVAEARNTYREQRYFEDGLLQDHMLVVPSCVAEGLDEELLDSRGEGFFTRTMTYCLQGTTLEGAVVTTESIFQTGTAASDKASYAERVDKRYDIAAIGMVYEWLGQAAPQSAIEMLERPLLVHKSLLPNGMVDFLRLCDIAADIVQGVSVDRPIEQYHQLIVDSVVREESLADVRAGVKQELLTHAGRFKEPMDAISLLWDLVKKHALLATATNHHIEPIVFGTDQRVHDAIILARMDPGNATAILTPVIPHAEISGCGGGSKKGDPNSPTEIAGEGARAGIGEVKGVNTVDKVTCPNCETQVILDRKKADEGILFCTACKTNQPLCGGPSYVEYAGVEVTSLGEMLAQKLTEYLGSIAAAKEPVEKRKLVHSA